MQQCTVCELTQSVLLANKQTQLFWKMQKCTTDTTISQFACLKKRFFLTVLFKRFFLFADSAKKGFSACKKPLILRRSAKEKRTV